MGVIGVGPIVFHRERAWHPSRRDRIIGAVAVVVFVAARLWHVGTFRLWFDEVFTFEAAARDWGELIWFVRNYDVHPPLFYMLTKVWIDIGGQSFLWLGLFPALTAVATLCPLYALARELRLSPGEFNLTLVLMALNGYLTGYAREFRAYNWLMFIAVCSLWLFVRYCNREQHAGPTRAIAPLAIVNLLMVYTHYYGWLLVGIQGLFLLWMRRRDAAAFTVASAMAVLAYLPWAYVVFRAASERSRTGEGALFFIPPPDAFGVASFYGALNGLYDVPQTTRVGLVLFGLPVVIWFWRSYVPRVPDAAEAGGAALLMALAFTVPVGIAFAASQVLPTAIWGQRHLILTAAPYYLLVSVAVLALPYTMLRRAAVAATVAWAVVAGVWAQVVPYKTPAWDQLVDHVLKHTPPGHPTRIYTIDEDAAFPMQFYLRRSGRPEIEVAVLHQDTPINRERFMGARVPYWALTLPVILSNDLRTLGGTPFWICDDREDAANLGQAGRSFPAVFAEAGYRVGEGKSAVLVNRRWTSRTVTVLPVTLSESDRASTAPSRH